MDMDSAMEDVEAGAPVDPTPLPSQNEPEMDVQMSIGPSDSVLFSQEFMPSDTVTKLEDYNLDLKKGVFGPSYSSVNDNFLHLAVEHLIELNAHAPRSDSFTEPVVSGGLKAWKSSMYHSNGKWKPDSVLQVLFYRPMFYFMLKEKRLFVDKRGRYMMVPNDKIQNGIAFDDDGRVACEYVHAPIVTPRDSNTSPFMKMLCGNYSIQGVPVTFKDLLNKLGSCAYDIENDVLQRFNSHSYRCYVYGSIESMYKESRPVAASVRRHEPTQSQRERQRRQDPSRDVHNVTARRNQARRMLAIDSGQGGSMDGGEDGGERQSKKAKLSNEQVRVKKMVDYLAEYSFSYQWTVENNIAPRTATIERNLPVHYASNVIFACFEQSVAENDFFPGAPSAFVYAQDDMEYSKKYIELYENPLQVADMGGWDVDLSFKVNSREASAYNKELCSITSFIPGVVADNPYSNMASSRGIQHQFLFLGDGSSFPHEIHVLSRIVAYYNMVGYAGYHVPNSHVQVSPVAGNTVRYESFLARGSSACHRTALSNAWGGSNYHLPDPTCVKVWNTSMTEGTPDVAMNYCMWFSVGMHPLMVKTSAGTEHRHTLWTVMIEGVEGFNTVGAFATAPNADMSVFRQSKATSSSGENLKACIEMHSEFYHLIDQQARVLEPSASMSHESSNWPNIDDNSVYSVLSPFRFIERVEKLVRNRVGGFSDVTVGGHLKFSDENRERLCLYHSLYLQALRRNIGIMRNLSLARQTEKQSIGKSTSHPVDVLMAPLPRMNVVPMPRYVIKDDFADTTSSIRFPDWVGVDPHTAWLTSGNRGLDSALMGRDENLQQDMLDAKEHLMDEQPCNVSHAKMIGCKFLSRATWSVDGGVVKDVVTGMQVRGCRQATHLLAPMVAIPNLNTDEHLRNVHKMTPIKCSDFMSKVSDTYMYPTEHVPDFDADDERRVKDHVAEERSSTCDDALIQYHRPGTDHRTSASISIVPGKHVMEQADAFNSRMRQNMGRMHSVLLSMSRVMSRGGSVLNLARDNTKLVLGNCGRMYGMFEHSMDVSMNDSHSETSCYVVGISPYLDGLRARRGAFFRLAFDKNITPTNCYAVHRLIETFAFLRSPNNSATVRSMRIPVYISLEGISLSLNIPTLEGGDIPLFRSTASGECNSLGSYCMENFKPNGTGADSVVDPAFVELLNAHTGSVFDVGDAIRMMRHSISSITKAAMQNMGSKGVSGLSNDNSAIGGGKESFGYPLSYTEVRDTSSELIGAMLTALNRDGVVRKSDAQPVSGNGSSDCSAREKLTCPNLVLISSNIGFGGRNNAERIKSMIPAWRMTPSSYLPIYLQNGPPDSARGVALDSDEEDFDMRDTPTNESSRAAPSFKMTTEEADYYAPVFSIAHRTSLVLLHANWAGSVTENVGVMASSLIEYYLNAIGHVFEPSILDANFDSDARSRVVQGSISASLISSLYYRVMGDLYADIRLNRETRYQQTHQHCFSNASESWQYTRTASMSEGDDVHYTIKYYNTLARLALKLSRDAFPTPAASIVACDVYADFVNPCLMYINFACASITRAPVVDYHFLQCFLREYSIYGKTPVWWYHPLHNNPVLRRLKAWLRGSVLSENTDETNAFLGIKRITGDAGTPATALANLFARVFPSGDKNGTSFWKKMHGIDRDYTPFMADTAYTYKVNSKHRGVFNYMQNIRVFASSLFTPEELDRCHDFRLRLDMMGRNARRCLNRNASCDSVVDTRKLFHLTEKGHGTVTSVNYSNTKMHVSQERSEGVSRPMLSASRVTTNDPPIAFQTYDVRINMMEHLFLISLYFGSPTCHGYADIEYHSINPLGRVDGLTNIAIGTAAVSPPVGHGFGDGVFTTTHYRHADCSGKPSNDTLVVKYNVHAEYFPRCISPDKDVFASISQCIPKTRVSTTHRSIVDKHMRMWIDGYMAEDLIHLSLIMEIMIGNSVFDMGYYRNIPVFELVPSYDITPGIAYPIVASSADCNYTDTDKKDSVGYIYVSMPNNEGVSIATIATRDDEGVDTVSTMHPSALFHTLAKQSMLVYPLIRRNAVVYDESRGLGMIQPLTRRLYDREMHAAMCRGGKEEEARYFFGSVGISTTFRSDIESGIGNGAGPYEGAHYFDHRTCEYTVRWARTGETSQIFFTDIHHYLVDMTTSQFYIEVTQQLRDDALKNTVPGNATISPLYLRVVLGNPSTIPWRQPTSVDPARMVCVSYYTDIVCSVAGMNSIWVDITELRYGDKPHFSIIYAYAKRVRNVVPSGTV